MRLKDYFTVYAGGDLQKDCFSPNKTDINKYPIFSNSLENYGLFGYSSKPNYLKNSLTITGRGNVGHSFYRSEDFDAIIRLLVLEPKKNVNSKYFNYLINHSVAFPIESTGVPQLTRPQVENTEVNVIHNSTQQDYIVNIMESIDNLIDSLEELKTKAELQLQAVMTTHFNSLDVENARLNTLLAIKKGTQFNGDKLSANGIYKMFNGGASYSGMLNQFNCDKDTIIISEGGNSCGFVNYVKERFWAGGHCYVVTPNKNIDKKYLFFALKQFQKKIMNLRVGSGLPNIQKKTLYQLEIKLSTNAKVQANYGAIFQSFSDRILEFENKIEKYKQIREGLLDAIFTGKIDVLTDYKEV